VCISFRCSFRLRLHRVQVSLGVVVMPRSDAELTPHDVMTAMEAQLSPFRTIHRSCVLRTTYFEGWNDAGSTATRDVSMYAVHNPLRTFIVRDDAHRPGRALSASFELMEPLTLQCAIAIN
jgi:hypothetical protein